MDDNMECIICQDDNSEYLQDNTFCDCKYKVHASCWIDYVHSKTIVTCLMCRKERVETKKEISYAPSLPTILEEQSQEQGQEQEQEQEQSQNAVQPQVITNIEINRKFIKLVICVVLLAFVLVIIST